MACQRPTKNRQRTEHSERPDDEDLGRHDGIGLTAYLHDRAVIHHGEQDLLDGLPSEGVEGVD